MQHPAASALLVLLAAPAAAAPYDFVPAPHLELNRVYRIDRATGEVGACQYGLQEGTLGVTLCFGPGEGAGAQAPAEYGLVASRHGREGGVFRVNYRSGEISVCYVFEDEVVCTPQAGPSRRRAEGAPPAGAATPRPAAQGGTAPAAPGQRSP